MREKLFFNDLKEELKRRGFFIVTDYAPYDCIHLFGISSLDDNEKYAEELQRDYRIAAVKNIEFCVGGESAKGWYEVLAGSHTKEPFPMIYINLKYNERYYKMGYQCHYIRDFICDDSKEATRYIVECVKFMTSSLMDVLQEWISEGKFPLHRFAEGSEDIITED